MITRRGFVGGAAAAALAGASGTARAADFRYRLGLSQPADSPNCIRLKEMAERLAADTHGALAIEVIPESKLGSDSAMIEMVRKGELELCLGDHIRGELAARGLRAFRHGMDNGFHQLTTRTRPIRSVEDLQGMKIRTPVQKMRLPQAAGRVLRALEGHLRRARVGKLA